MNSSYKSLTIWIQDGALKMLCSGNRSLVAISELVLKHIFNQNSKVHTNQIKIKASKHMQTNFVEKKIKWKKQEVIKTHGVGF